MIRRPPRSTLFPLHDALPIFSATIPSRLSSMTHFRQASYPPTRRYGSISHGAPSSLCNRDRKSTRLNSSHGYISYAVFCLKKKKKHHEMSSNRHTHSHSQPSG